MCRWLVAFMVAILAWVPTNISTAAHPGNIVVKYTDQANPGKPKGKHRRRGKE